MRIALSVEYDGTAYHGWQRQEQVASVQGQLEKALSLVADHPLQITCAGRTDAGVHALGQIVHFDTSAVRAERAWVMGANTHLASDICVLHAQEVAADFHARYSATARQYHYVIYNSPISSAILHH